MPILIPNRHCYREIHCFDSTLMDVGVNFPINFSFKSAKTDRCNRSELFNSTFVRSGCNFGDNTFFAVQHWSFSSVLTVANETWKLESFLQEIQLSSTHHFPLKVKFWRFHNRTDPSIRVILIDFQLVININCSYNYQPQL